MALSGLLLVLTIAGQVPLPGSLSAPPSVDHSPTAWSCNVTTLISGKDCVFEVEEAPSDDTDTAAQEASNIRAARALAPIACGKVARAHGKEDKKLSDLCQREFAAVAETCGLEGTVPLVDGKGRFAPQARGCYLQLSDVLQRTTFSALSSSQCCQCLAASCKAPPEKCYRNLARATPDRSELSCIQGACAEACANAPVSGVEPSQGATPTGGASLPPPSRKAPARHVSHEI
ncbi:MAG TPA: hypothetical protein VK447_13770 [Myxococcaceae bacterium]|nr:hypothetical protein [Myxococcaceae bacterium]